MEVIGTSFPAVRGAEKGSSDPGLDRIQIVKESIDADGGQQSRIYDVAGLVQLVNAVWSDYSQSTGTLSDSFAVNQMVAE